MSDTDLASAHEKTASPETVPQMDWAWLAAAFETAPMGMVIVDERLTVLRINRPLLEKLDCGDHEAVGKNFDVFVANAHDAALQAMVLRCFDRAGGTLRTSLVGKGGRQLVCELTVAPLTRKESDHPQALIMCEFNAAEKRDAEAQARLAALVNASPDAILSTSPEGFITSWNAGAEKMFGYQGDEILWRPIALLVRDDGGDFKNQHQRVLKGATVRRAEVRCVHHGGGLIDSELSLAPILNSQGRVAGVSIVARDVTELNRLREETARNRENAIEMEQHNRMMELKTHFLNQAAHELHTPLTPIVIQLHMIRAMDGLPAALTRNLAVLDRNLTRLNQLVNNVVTATRLQMDEGKELVVRKPIDLSVVVNHAVATHRAVALQRGIELHLKADRKLPIVGDEARLNDVLVNFLSNALRFTPAGGVVTVEAMEARDSVLVRVHDGGPGLGPNDLDHLFQPFGRAVVPGVNVGDGSGLGLFISRAIIEHHHGRIWAQSDGPGKGSVFSFEIPKTNA